MTMFTLPFPRHCERAQWLWQSIYHCRIPKVSYWVLQLYRLWQNIHPPKCSGGLLCACNDKRVVL